MIWSDLFTAPAFCTTEHRQLGFDSLKKCGLSCAFSLVTLAQHLFEMSTAGLSKRALSWANLLRKGGSLKGGSIVSKLMISWLYARHSWQTMCIKCCATFTSNSWIELLKKTASCWQWSTYFNIDSFYACSGLCPEHGISGLQRDISVCNMSLKRVPHFEKSAKLSEDNGTFVDILILWLAAPALVRILA